eukprot:723237-Rhodomonas_salina.3
MSGSALLEADISVDGRCSCGDGVSQRRIAVWQVIAESPILKIYLEIYFDANSEPCVPRKLALGLDSTLHWNAIHTADS